MKPNNLGEALAEMNNLMTSSMDYARSQCLKNCALDIIQIAKEELQNKRINNPKMFVNVCNRVMDLANSYQKKAKEIESKEKIQN
tara:strand:- start:370 stop:624 length:255 start_codon:yes stop_codon:yes gene_type:complete